MAADFVRNFAFIYVGDHYKWKEEDRKNKINLFKVYDCYGFLSASFC